MSLISVNLDETVDLVELQKVCFRFRLDLENRVGDQASAVTDKKLRTRRDSAGPGKVSGIKRVIETIMNVKSFGELSRIVGPARERYDCGTYWFSLDVESVVECAADMLLLMHLLENPGSLESQLRCLPDVYLIDEEDHLLEVISSWSHTLDVIRDALSIEPVLRTVKSSYRLVYARLIDSIILPNLSKGCRAHDVSCTLPAFRVYVPLLSAQQKNILLFHSVIPKLLSSHDATTVREWRKLFSEDEWKTFILKKLHSFARLSSLADLELLTNHAESLSGPIPDAGVGALCGEFLVRYILSEPLSLGTVDALRNCYHLLFFGNGARGILVTLKACLFGTDSTEATGLTLGTFFEKRARELHLEFNPLPGHKFRGKQVFRLGGHDLCWADEVVFYRTKSTSWREIAADELVHIACQHRSSTDKSIT